MTTTLAPPTPAPHPAQRHLAALIIGCLLILPGLGMLLGGAGVAGAYAFGRDDSGFLSMNVTTLRSPTAAITIEDMVVESGPDVPTWVLDRLDLDLRMTAQPITAGSDLFLGVAPASAVTSYLGGVAHDQVIGITEARFGGSRAAILRTSAGKATVAAPTAQPFWAESATGPGQQQLTWRVTGGRWAAVLMNADGSPGVDVSATVGVRAGFLLPVALLLLGLGLIVTGIAVALIIRGASSSQPSRPVPPAATTLATADAWQPHPRAVSPVSLNARLDEPLSRWLWLVKWFLAIPHYFLLGFLWIAFFVVSVVAFFAILFTGQYPRGLFDFNLGVLRWSWRVAYYSSNGGLGTDRYPPFSLGEEPDYPARLDIAYPERLSRGLVLVKWWLLAIPHYIILGFLIGGGGWAWTASRGDGAHVEYSSWGLLGLLVLVAGLSLLFTSRYPRALFDLVIGLNRWVYRVIAYAALMTDVYPPFQLDEGGAEIPLPPPGPPAPPGLAGPSPASEQVAPDEPAVPPDQVTEDGSPAPEPIGTQ